MRVPRPLSRVAAALALVAAFALPTLAADWTILAEKVTKSVVYIELENGSCSGAVINDAAGDKGELDYVLTAAHCDGKEIYVDQVRAYVKTKDVKSDLMVLQVANLDRPALKLAKDEPKVGEEIASIGYGYGLEKPLFRVTHASATDLEIPELSGQWVLTDATFVPGQSGGPVVNLAGEYVMIVQMGTNSVGVGKGAATIRGKVGKYFGK